MKHTFFYMMMAAALTACGHRASTGNGADADSVNIDSTDVAMAIALQTDSIGMERVDSTAEVRVSVDWPVDGNEELVASVRRYILGDLGIKNVQNASDGKQLLNRFGQEQYKELHDMWIDAREEGYGGDMTYSLYRRIWKYEETATYVTYMSNGEGFTGGAHGWAMSTGMTFSKIDGQAVGYQQVYDEKHETWHVKNQRLFKDTKSARFRALLKEGLRSYFDSFEEGTKTSDAELQDQLQGTEIDNLPLPQYPPYFTKDGLLFSYQQYEITCYALGMPSFVISYDKILSFLTDEAKALVSE